MSRKALGRVLARIASAILVASVTLVAPVALGAEEKPSPVVSEAITNVLRDKVSELLDRKDAQGFVVARGAYSTDFRKADDSAYAVTFYRSTVEKDTEKVERLLLTIKKGADGKWAVAKEEVQDTDDRLHRELREQDEFFRFDKLSFDRHGMKVTATNGSLFKTYFMGRPSGITLAAEDLAYQFTPPKNLPYHATYGVILKQYGDRFVFDPQKVEIAGDGASCEEILASAFTGLRKVAKGETSSKLQGLYDDDRRDWEKDLKESGFYGFRPAYEPDRKTWNVAVKRSGGEERWVWLGYDNYEAWDVQFGAADAGYEGRAYQYPVFGWYSDEVLKSTSSPADLERRADLDARDYEVDSVVGTVEIGLENPDALTGEVTFGLTAMTSLREIEFRISRTQRVGDEVAESKNPKILLDYLTDGDGNNLSWVKTSPYSGMVLLPKAVPAGSKLTIKMKYTHLDAIYKLNPSYSYVERGSWLPFVRFNDLIEKFDVTTKIASKYTLLGVGKRESEVKQGGITVTRWTSDLPVSFPTIIFGDYVTDTSAIKATKSDGSEIPVHIYVDKISTHAVDSYESATSGASGIRGKQMQPLADQAANALNLYRTVYGVDYPFAKLDLVNTPDEFMAGALAQSPGSMIYVISSLFRGEGTTGASSRSSEATKQLKDTVAHETGHQWWGASVTAATYRSYWFVESLAEYSAAIFVENVYSPKKYDEKVAEWRRSLLRWDNLTSVEDAPVLWGGENPGAARIINIYYKGPYVFHVLRRTFGDEKFFAFLKRLGTELKGKQIITRDIQRVAEESYGFTMEWFFNQWIRGVGLPQYALSYDVKQTEDGKWLVDGKIRQRVIAGKSNSELPGVYFKARGWLTFEFGGGTLMKYPAKAKSPGEQEKMFVVDGAETPFKVKLPEKPVAVYFNKDGEILAHDVLVNQSW